MHIKVYNYQKGWAEIGPKLLAVERLSLMLDTSILEVIIFCSAKGITLMLFM